MEIYCKHCGDELIEGKNHSDDSYELDVCDECMDKNYGYCDECHKLFLYYSKMNEHHHPTGSVLCPQCRPKFQYRARNRNLPLKFEPYAKTVSLHYPDNIEHPNLLEYCGTHWENLLVNFFEKQKCVVNTDTNNGMTSQAIEISFKYETSDDMIEEICNQAIQLILQASRPKFKVGSAATFTTTQSDLIQYDGQGVTIQRILSEDECDIDEVGFMYEVMNFNGNKFQAFEEELF